MNTKLIVLLGGVGAVHLAAGALFIAGGCTQEDPPMPPGIYVPRQPVQEHSVKPAPVTETAGNAELTTETPAALPQETPPPAPAVPEAAPEPRGDKVYIVVKNDSLWLIARKNGMTIEELASYNNLSPKTKLRVGQKLHIPPTGKKAVKNGVPKAKDKSAAPVKKGKKGVKNGRKNTVKASEKLPADGIYTVRANDNFSLIAKRFGIKVSDIMAANPGVDSSRLKIGQKLRLTAGAAQIAKPAKSAAKKSKAKTAKSVQPKKESQVNSAPAAEAKTNTSADDPEALLNSIKQPQENAAPEKKPENAAPSAAAPAGSQDKDRLVKESNGNRFKAGSGILLIG